MCNNFDSNGDNVLSDSEILKVVSIDVNCKAITSMKGIEYFTALQWLDCSSSKNKSYNFKNDNKFVALDVSNNKELLHLDCSTYTLEELNVKNCSKLEYLNCGDYGYWGSQKIKSLDVSDCVALKYFNCSRTGISKLDLSNNTALETLICYETDIDTLDLTHNTKLKKFNCAGEYAKHMMSGNYSGYFISLDLSKNTELIELICSGNPKLATLDLSNNKKLETLDCHACNITELNINNNNSLKFLDCSSNKIAKLDVANKILLEHLDCNRNNLSELDISKLVNLEYFACYGNNLPKAIDVSNNIKLEHLDCYRVKDLSKNTALKYLRCYGQIDISKCLALTQLYCGGEGLKTLDLSQNKLIAYLRVEDSSLTNLEASNLKKLEWFWIYYNDKLISVNASGSFSDNAFFTSIECENNSNLVSVDLSESNANMVAIGGKVQELNLKNCSLTGMDSFFLCWGNALTYLELPHSVYSNYREQKRLNLSYTVISNEIYPYQFDFRECMPESKLGAIASESIKAIDKYENNIEFSYSDGIVKLKSEPAEIQFLSKIYYFDKKAYSDTDSMDVSLLFYGNPKIMTSEIPAAYIGEEYYCKLESESEGKVEWSIDYRKLPEQKLLFGFSFDNTGIIKGRTYEKGYTASFDITATNKAGSTSKTFNFIVAGKPKINETETLKVTSPKNKSYSSSVKVSDGVAPYKWTVSKGSLPKGLKLYNKTSAKVTLKGKPTVAKTYNFTLTVTDKHGYTASKEQTITITAPTISGDLKTSGVVKKSYSSSLTISGGTYPYTWEKSSGTLPKGLELVPNTKGTKITLKGTPKTAKSYTFTLKATDKNGATATKKFTVKVTAPIIKGELKTSGVVKKLYSSSLTISGGTYPYTWKKSSGTLPTGLELVPNTTGTKITLKGTPKTAKSYTFTLKAIDKNGATATSKVTIVITKPTIKGELKTSGVVKKSYSSSLTISGGTYPYTWKKSSGTLPKGLELVPNTKGTKITLKGTPKVAKSYTFTLKATDKNGATATLKVTIVITKAEQTKSSAQDKNSDLPQHSEAINKIDEYSDFIKEDLINEGTEEFSSYGNNFASLEVLSDDILWQGEGKDEDLFGVKAGNPVTFVIKNPCEDMRVYINDNLSEDIIISEEGVFTIPAEFVSDDFKVKAQKEKLATEELFMSVE